MAFIESIISNVSNALYSYILIILLIAAGIYFTVRTKFVSFRLFKEQIRAVTEKNDKNGVSSFQALMISTASRVGTGNIVGVSTALCLGGFGPVFITVAMILFAFTTLIGNLYYVDKCVIHLAGKVPSKKVQTVIHIISALVIFAGAGLSADLLWSIADITMGGMTLINIPVIVILSKYALRALKDYEQQRKQGLEPVFKAKNIDLPHEVDCWK